MPSQDVFIDLGDRRLRVRRLAPAQDDGLDRTALVFLHEGLGCIEMWRDFPQKLCDATRCAGIVYDRTGYGRSSAWPSDPGVRYMEIEADLVLPRLLAAKATLVFYGPFNIGGQFTSASNKAFDAQLRADHPGRGIRDLEAVQALAAGAGLAFIEDIPMPANNRCLVFEK